MPADPRNPMNQSLGLDRAESALARRPMTAKALAQTISVAKRSAVRYLRELQHQGRVHIGGWGRTPGNKPVSVYAVGPGANCSRPQAISGAENARWYRARQRGLATPLAVVSPQIQTTWRFDASNRPAEGQKAME